jgi:ABC-type phosphate/phosphonate transport system substrate-binding protein
MIGSQRRIAALPMYDYPELADAHDALWAVLSRRLTEAGIEGVPAGLTRSHRAHEVWGHPQLLLAQGCEYPLAKSFAAMIRLVATPHYRVPGCEGAHYRSAIVVRIDDPAASLADLRGRRCVVNERDSNSGMNLFRAAIAPFAGGGPFFGAVTLSGAHRRSAEMIAAGQADVAALDCVSFAHFQRLSPETTSALRVLAWTPASPSLPLITAATTDDATLARLRSCLQAVAEEPGLKDVRARLFLDGFDLEPRQDFGATLELEKAAERLAYPQLI